MPFNSNAFPFNQATINTVYEVGAVYGLFCPSAGRPGYFRCLYVGRTDNLRRRLGEHLNNPPVVGATHFFAEAYVSDAQRRERETALIAEFQPVGNTQLRR